ncbi:MAG: Holliday junction ATP-dependent DNA helicase RuvB [Sodalis sp.]|uniref:DNA polymerase III subunit gamma/tau n=1 Tax=Sodalis sp. (in: enterobacteria) TaxID=1898979 RepID=UPI003873B488|nr:MAG: Holliday junction ATP-dependent DNA helicase RuvB [Sodalis sp.]
MSYQVLARKWRPQTFANVVGQEHVLTALANSLSLGRIHHAYLLSGTRGVGKTTIARLLAKGLNCETGITATPCIQCDSCLEIEQGRFVDLIEIDSASRTKVEDTRDLLDNVQYVPTRGRFKVYLIDEVHMLSRHSFNALLKTLEEPPVHVKFLLATTDPQKLPLTILSRCLQFHLKALDVEQIRNQLSTVLQQEHIAAAPRALQLLARAADGSMRDALSLADQAIATGRGEVSAEAVSLMLGTLNTEQPLALIEALADADGGAMMAQLAQCAARGMDWETLLLEMLSLLHRLAMGQLLSDQLNDEEDPGIVPRLRELARRLPPADLQLYYQTLLIGRKELPFAPDPRMGVEMTLLRALAFHPAAVSAEVIPANAEKKTAEFSSGTGHGGSAAGAVASLWPASVDRVTSRADVNDPPLAKSRPGALPDIAPLAASERVPSPHVDQGRLSASGKAAGVRMGDGSDSPTYHDAHASHVTGLAVPWHVPTIRQATAVDSADESLMEVYAASGFDDDEVQAEWQLGAVMPENTEPPAPSPGGDSPLPASTAQLLRARTALLQRQESQKTKGVEPARQKAAVSALERLATVGKRAQQRQPAAGREDSVKAPRLEVYHWRANQQPEAKPAPVITPNALCTAPEHEKMPELALSLAEEALERDPWAAQVHRLAVPKLVQLLALNTWKEDLAPGKVCLHLRTSQRHLNSATAQNTLRDALSADFGAPIELTVTEDDNPVMKTPLEWRQAIYEEKLMRAREVMMNDSHIQMLRRFFDAELDEDSIRPV